MSLEKELAIIERIGNDIREIRLENTKVEAIKPNSYYINKKSQKFKPDLIKKKARKTASINGKSHEIIRRPYGINDCESYI